MSRVIKFRGFIGDGIWLYGSLTEIMVGSVRCAYIMDEYDPVVVYESSVGQFTGLKDKNGVDIYEGDIIRIYSNDNGYLLVEFKNHYVGGWVLTSHESEGWVSLGARKACDIEVIGNIHENPELLEAK